MEVQCLVRMKKWLKLCVNTNTYLHVERWPLSLPPWQLDPETSVGVCIRAPSLLTGAILPNKLCCWEAHDVGSLEMSPPTPISPTPVILVSTTSMRNRVYSLGRSATASMGRYGAEHNQPHPIVRKHSLGGARIWRRNEKERQHTVA